MSETEHDSDELDETAAPDEESAGDELDDETQAELDEQAETDEQAEQADEQSSLAMVQALDKEATRHEKALAKALGIAPETMHLCPTCEGMGYTPEPMEAESEPPFDPYLARCERCDGSGRVRTHARPSAMFELPCPGCTGQGYVQLPEQPTAQAELGNGTVTYAPPASPAAVAPGDADALADLRRRGYTIVEPIVVPESVSA